MERKNRGFQRLVKAAAYSWAGLCAVWRHEAAFRQEVLLACIAGPLGIWLGANGVERALLLGSILLIMIIELVNSAVEAVVDRHGTEFHELAGRAKDVGSAAVLLSLINAALVWGLVLLTGHR
jgi:diacylglycerol kinase (ATP)